jgi:uncharacterized protein (TIGR03437 family)
MRKGQNSSLLIRFNLIASLMIAISSIGFGVFAIHNVNPAAQDVQANMVTTVSAASFESVPVAPESIVAAFGVNLATQTVVAADTDPNQSGIQLPTELGGTTVEINGRRASLFFVSPGQVNCTVPAATEAGQANVVIRAGNGTVSNGTVQIAQAAPSIFTANANGSGVPAATILRVKANGQQTFEPVAQFNEGVGRFVTRPIDLGPEGERVFLVLFLTGIRRVQDVNGDGNLNESVRVLVGGNASAPFFAGTQPIFAGLDQINYEIPRSLVGRGIVNISINAPGFATSNPVEIEIGGSAGTSPPQIVGFGSAMALAGQELIINGGGFSTNAVENLVRIAGSNATVISASSSQLRVVVPFGVETGTVSVRTPQGESVSASALPVRTSISGLVENTSRQPMSDVEVKVSGTNISVKTNSEGAFVLPDVPVGPQFVEVNGGSIPVDPPYPRVTLKITAQSSRDNQFTRPIALQQSTGASGTIGTGSALVSNTIQSSEIDSQAQPPVVIQTGGFQLDVPLASTANFPGGATRGAITLTPLLNGRTPVNLPFGYHSASVVQITPFNVRIGLGAKLTLPNTESLPPGTKVELFRYDPQEGLFVREPETALVSADGRRIETTPGAIKITYFYFAAVFRQTTTITGRVLERDGRAVSRALVSFRGQEALTDGTGTYVLRYVPVNPGEQVSVEVSYVRSATRIERIQSASVAAVLNGITNIPDVILPGERDNRPPAILATPRLELEEGKTYDAGVVVNDPDQGQSVEVAASGVSFASLIKGAGGNYTLRLSPNFTHAGEYKLTLSATDIAGATTKHEIAIIVKNVNRAPTASSQTVNVDQNGSVAIRLDGSDPDGDALSYRIVTQPSRGSLTGSAPNLTYRPNQNYTGPDSFTFRVNDGLVDSATATVSINVRAVNRAPIVNVPGAQSVNEGQALSFPISATDPDAGQTLMLTTTGLPSGATVVATGATSRQFRWTPNFTQSGTYSVTFRATDNGTPPMSDAKTVQITVIDVPVLLVPGSQRVTQGSTLTFTVFISQAAAGLPITISGVNLPQGASLTQSGNSARFSWPTSFNTAPGNYTVTFRATYSGALAVNESKNVTITVDRYIIPLKR